tara:strand:+ start:604 stop:798 length:195 start_codon:yes stop_codon:yes gene_type:complete
LDVSSKKLENTVKIGINTIKETINEDKNQIFKFFNISDYILMYDFDVSTTNPYLLWTQERKIKN